MRPILVLPAMLLFAACVPAQQPEIAILRNTSSAEARPDDVRTVAQYLDIVSKHLQSSGILFNVITDEQAIEGKLTAYKLAIMPFGVSWPAEEVAKLQEYVAGGGKLLWFYAAPRDVYTLLGIEKTLYRHADYPGEFHSMEFADAPPGFPVRVRQQSPNGQIAQQLAEGARAMAVWHDTEGKNTGVPAVVESGAGLWVSHVLWGDADVFAQQHFVLAAVGHSVPGTWERLVEGLLSGAATAADFESLELLQKSVQGNVRAEPLAEKALADAQQARAALAAGDYTRALTLARGVGDLAQRAAAAAYPSRPYELRGAWMGFPASGTDWEQIMTELEAANFNAIFPLMCSPAAAAYPSEYVPQITNTDELNACIEAAHRHGIEVHPWKANWQLMPTNEERQKQYSDEGRFILSVEQAGGAEETSSWKWSMRWLDPSDERNRELEYNQMTEMVEKFGVDGIHFDFMRYPEPGYCYCDRCREAFQKWAGVTVGTWPDDCWGSGKHVSAFRDWRRHLLTSLVKRISERIHEIRPEARVSLAARASLSGSFEGDAQDWVTWAKEGYLDFLCPMDYTDTVESLRAKLEPQMKAIDGRIPVYAGIGVSPTRSSTPVNLSQQITEARRLGADGFLLFSLTGFSRDMLPVIALGVTSGRVTLRPDSAQSVTARFTYPRGIEWAPERTYAAGESLLFNVSVEGAADVRRLTYRVSLMYAEGVNTGLRGFEVNVDKRRHELPVSVQPEPGTYQLIVTGDAALDDGAVRPFYLRSRTFRVLGGEEMQEMLERVRPPVFETDKPHVGIILGGYGSEGILEALQRDATFEVKPIYKPEPEYVAPCDVVVLPQMRDIASLDTGALAAVLGDFVRTGGGLLVTHDAVGMRQHPAVFPDQARGLAETVRETTVVVAAEHPVTAGMEVGQSFTHAYYDHIPLHVGEGATAVITNEAGNPVVACAQVGQGRYVACGIALGLRHGDADTPPSGGELKLLRNAVKWLVRE